MLKSKTLQKGFTIVELLIVIVVIGILAGLVLNTFSGVQKRARDTQRQTDLNSLATQLEVYYNDNAGYPLLASINNTTLKGLDSGATMAPGQTTSSMTATGAPTKDQYGYQTWAADGTTACATAPCAKFTLTYLRENDNTVQSKLSLN
ncbi:prepilin-type N-terminal cleavage/methylation domain-containing protein [Pedobacter sp.]|nr:prepilin-type N-terminal cleavage/methylation domain-containing protein [Candidatus Saccharibacteria bacterium]